MDTTIADANTAATSSTATAAPATEVHVDNAASTTAAADAKPQSIADIVKSIQTKYAKPEDSSTPQPSDSKKEPDEKKEPDTEVKQDDKVKEEPLVDEAKKKDEDARLDKNPRFHEVIQQKNLFETQVRDLKPVAERMANVEKYCRDNQIMPEDFKQSLELAALVKTNPQEALKRLMPVIESLKLSTGESLPADLQAKVDEHLMTVDDAKRETKLRVELAQAKQLRERDTQASSQRQQQELTSSLNAWTQSKATLDPTFKPKTDASQPDGRYELVAAKFLQLWNTVPVNSIQDAVGLAERAFADVDSFTKTLIPKPVVHRRPVTSTRSSTNQTTEQIDVTKSGWGRRVAAEVLNNH